MRGFIFEAARARANERFEQGSLLGWWSRQFNRPIADLEKLDISGGELLEEFYMFLHEQDMKLDDYERRARAAKNTEALQRISSKRQTIKSFLSDGQGKVDEVEEALLQGGQAALEAFDELITKLNERRAQRAKLK